jgi:hypothetical protein
MSTAVVSSSRNSHHGIPVERRAAATQTGSSAAADEAIRRLIAGQRFKGSQAPEHRRRSSAQRTDVGRPPKKHRRAAENTGVVSRASKLFAFLASGCLVAAAIWFVIPTSTRLHGVAGSVRIDEAPLANGVLEFHLTSPSSSGKAFSTMIHTDADGMFQRLAAAGLPEGRYAVVVRSRGPIGAEASRARPVAIPPAYTQLASTPLSVEIAGSAAGLDLVVRK